MKLIPDVEDNNKLALRQFIVTRMKYGEFHEKFSAKTNYIKSEYSKYDTWHEILKNANKK